MTRAGIAKLAAAAAAFWLLSGCAEAAQSGSNSSDSSEGSATSGESMVSEEKQMKYTFTKVTYEEFSANTRQPMAGEWIYGDVAAGDKEFALFFGRARAVFGEPSSTSSSWEEMYEYYIKAESPDGVFYLSVYHGAGGPSVCIPLELEGAEKQEFDLAKTELIALIQGASPADYVWEGVYEDIPVNVTYIVRDGVAEVISDFDEADF